MSINPVTVGVNTFSAEDGGGADGRIRVVEGPSGNSAASIPINLIRKALARPVATGWVERATNRNPIRYIDELDKIGGFLWSDRSPTTAWRGQPEAYDEVEEDEEKSINTSNSLEVAR